MKNLKEYWLEIVFGISGIAIALALTFITSTDAAIIIGIFVPVIAVATAIVRLEINNAVSDAESEVLAAAASSREVVEKMAEMDGIALKHAKRHLESFLTRIREIHSGEIFLTMPEYFNTALDCLSGHGDGDVVYAINSKGGFRWQEDPRQRVYKSANYAASDRGVTINRIFIIEKGDLRDASFGELKNVIKEHMEKDNINIYILFREMLENVGMPHEHDWVYMEKPYRKVLVDYADAKDPLRGSHAYMYTGDNFIDKKIEFFNQLVQLAEPRETVTDLLKT